MPHPPGALPRAVADLTLRNTISMRKRDQRDRDMGLTEIMQQFQVEISGTGGSVFGFAATSLAFDFPFYYAPAQRDPDFNRPHFWHGAECSPAMAVTACVTDWSEDEDNGAVIGAVVVVGVAGPVEVYSGYVHLTFQGFSALAEETPTDPDEGAA